jgi:DNA replication protein DnaC
MTPNDLTRLDAQLHHLHLHYIQSHYQTLATKAAEQQRSHLDYLEQLVEGEATMRENRSIERRIKNARFPVLKSLDDFQWSWPKKINRSQIQNLFRLAFIATQTNVVLIGNVGLGKTHLSIALGHAACLNGHSVLFTTAVDIINTLAAAQSAGKLKRAAVLTMDGVGEWATTSAGCGEGSKLALTKEIHFPHSLGLLYSAFTYYTGFKVNSGEYKVMGLAPYGEPKYAQLILIT